MSWKNMPKVQLIKLTVVICLLVPASLASYGQNCETPLAEEGTCVPLRSCAGAHELLQYIYKFGEENSQDEISFLKASKCDSKDETNLVCCPRKNIQINPLVYKHLETLNCGNNAVSRVSKGQVARLFDFRWMALLKYEGKKPFACGGSLIDDRHVLTAAHCLHDFENLPIAVRLGEYDLQNDTDCSMHGRHVKCLAPVQDIGIEKYIVHEDYIYKGVHHDLAILRLERSVNLSSKSIRPICLPISKELQAGVPQEFLAAGWGRTEFGNRSNVLLWTALYKRSGEYCEDLLRLKLSEEHICAGGNRFHDTCKGDSGGPIFYPDIYVDGVARAIQYGVVSFGSSKCGHLNVPAVYMNVTHYIQWITDHMVI